MCPSHVTGAVTDVCHGRAAVAVAASHSASPSLPALPSSELTPPNPPPCAPPRQVGIALELLSGPYDAQGRPVPTARAALIAALRTEMRRRRDSLQAQEINSNAHY